MNIENDPLEIVRQMAEKGITLFVIACEPSLSQHYQVRVFSRCVLF